MQRRKVIFWVILGIITGPILTNILLSFSTPITFGDDWEAFYGNYMGALLGGFTAFFISNYQIKKQIEHERQKEREANRAFIYIEDFSGPPRLHNIETSSDSRIILTDEYEELIDNTDKEILKTYSMAFYKIRHIGNSDVILNCSIDIYFTDETGNKQFHINTNVGLLNKQDELFIPLYRKAARKINMNKAEVKYTTLSGERMMYIHDLVNSKESYWIVKNDLSKELIFEVLMSSSRWLYPRRIK